MGKRRGHNEGTIVERSPGVWHVQVSLGSVGGERRRISRNVRGTKKEAQRVLAELTLAPPSNAHGRTVADLLDAWLPVARARVEATTAWRYADAAERLIRPQLGGVELDRLSARQIDTFYADVAASSPSMARSCHVVLGVALEQAMRWEWVSSNATRKASPPTVRKADVVPPSLATIGRILAVIDDPNFCLFVGLAAVTGARRGEFRGLRWQDVSDGRLVIAQAVVNVSGVGTIVKRPKSGRQRVLALDDPWSRRLLEHRAEAMETAAAFSAVLGGSAFVFSREPDASKPWLPGTVTHSFGDACRRAGVTGVRLHDLRHFAATQMLATGVDVRTVAGRLGHSNPTVTLNVYAAWLPERDMAAAEALGALVGPTSARSGS